MAYKMTAARRKAIKTAKMWQSRSRAKDRRYKGSANLSDYSPTAGEKVDFSSMSTRDIQKYTHSLSGYVSERMRRLPSGEIVSGREYRKLKSTVSRENRRRRRLREDISGAEVREGAPRRDILSVEDVLSESRRLDPRTLKPIQGPSGSGSPLEPIALTEVPPTRAAFDRMMARMQDIVKRPDSLIYDRYRRSAVGMAEQTGDPGLVRKIQGLSDRQLMFAVERMGLIEQLALIYTPGVDIEEFRASTSELQAFGEYDENVRAISDDVDYLKRNVIL